MWILNPGVDFLWIFVRYTIVILLLQVCLIERVNAVLLPTTVTIQYSKRQIISLPIRAARAINQPT